MSGRAFCVAALIAASAGCAPARQWGTEARYAPEVRGYFIGHAIQPSLLHPTKLLRDPATGKKLRCREQLEPYLGPITDEVATRAHDSNASLATLLVTMGVLLPVSAAGVTFGGAGEDLLTIGEGFGLLLSSPSAGTLYARGKRAFDEKRPREAERFFERALAKWGRVIDDPWTPRFDGRFGPLDVERSSYFLGLLYEGEGRPRDAARAYRQFVERAAVRDRAAYEEAEKRLAALEPGAVAPCRSQEPLTITWRSR
jgi:hypothetical protein